MNPVLIIGAPRSGTTWLGNILTTNYGFSSPHHPLHYGVKESNLFNCILFYRRKPFNNDPAKYIPHFSKGDFFKLCFVKPERYLNRDYSDFTHFFLDILDDFAIKEKSNGWCIKLCPQFLYNEKSRTKYFQILNERYKEIKLIYIQRQVEPYMLSYLNMTGKSHKKRSSLIGRQIAQLVGLIRYNIINSYAEKLILQKKGLKLTYENFTSNFEENTVFIENYLNTSYRYLHEKENTIKNQSEYSVIELNEFHIGLATKIVAGNKIVGKNLLKFLDKRHHGKDPNYYRLLKLKENPEQLLRDLTNSNDIKLIDWVLNQK